MTHLSADLAQQKQKLREKLRFRRKHFAANLDEMAQLAAFRALPAPLTELLAEHAIVGAYVAWGAEP
ncbi:MAG: 5-formyltetrahydrofolate cyclo-ligase, partial [Sphingopyxis sp.]|nr:5-formyltetrahydrofolate cyclo-ligase [Sphingopyxis sp.]